MPFQKGIAYNPGGRPRKTKSQVEFEARCQEYLKEKGWKAIEEMMQNRDVKVKQWALQTMLDRGYGRPTEVVDVTARDESSYGIDGLTESIAELIAGTESQSAGAGESSQGAPGEQGINVLPAQPGTEAIH